MARLHFWVMLQNTFLLGVIWLHSLIKVDLCDGYMICIFLPLFVQDSGCITKDYMELWVTLAWNKRSLKLIIIIKKTLLIHQEFLAMVAPFKKSFLASKDFYSSRCGSQFHGPSQWLSCHLQGNLINCPKESWFLHELLTFVHKH